MIRLMLTCLMFVVTSASAAEHNNPAANAETGGAAAWVMPRTEYGAPDFQGIWFFGSRTPLQRPRNLGTQTTYSEQEIREQERRMRLRLDDQAAPLNPDRSAPEAGAEIRQEADDAFLAHYLEPVVTPIAGEYRTSVITEPPDGRVPATRSGFQDLYARRQAQGLSATDGPEGQPLSGRCLIFGAAIPSLTPMMMNPNLQIVQNENYVVVMTEMIHDARIIRLGKAHHNDGINRWMGDSVGHWEGDTLVVHSQHFRPEQSASRMGFRVSEQFEVIERYTLTSDETIHYGFTVNDPEAYGVPISGERTLTRNPPEERLYDFECHEGNYSLAAILRGARMTEVRAALGR